MDTFFPDQAAKWCRGRWHPRMPVDPLCELGVDSRRARPGQLFFALEGTRSDGHEYLAEVAAAGAYAVVRGDFPPEKLSAAGYCLQVEDPLAALGQVAAGYRAQLPGRIVGVTGSVGKTTTRELIADALSEVGRTARSAGNFNNRIGLPLSLSGMGRDCAYGAFEAGISAPGEMALLRGILQPDIAVVTPIGPAHIEFFGSVRAIAGEKAVLLEKLPADGFAVLNADDEFFELLQSRSSAPVVTCSLKGREADYAGEVQADGSLRVVERATGESAVLPVPSPGGFMAGNALQAVAVARRCEVPWGALKASLRQTLPVGMRWAVEEIRGWTAVNDGYNANPLSMQAALDAFARRPSAGRKFLALGPMLELGAWSRESHETLGRRVARGPWAGVAWVAGGPAPAADPGWKAFTDGLRAEGWPEENLCAATLTRDAAEWLRARLHSGDALLLKASRGVGIEHVLNDLKKES